VLDERQIKMSKDMSDARNAVDFVMTELQHVQVQLGVAGSKNYFVISLLFLSIAMDLQHIFKCKGTFVGHNVRLERERERNQHTYCCCRGLCGLCAL
jgi:hypothetical protein